MNAVVQQSNSQPRLSVGVHSPDHFKFGLDVRTKGDEFGLHASASPHRWGRVRADTRKSLDYLSLGAYADAMRMFRERVRKRGIEGSRRPTRTTISNSGCAMITAF